MKRGTGYVAKSASWEGGDGKVYATFKVDPSAHPWGPDGGPYLKDSTLAPAPGAPMDAYWRRYAGGLGKPLGPQASLWGIGAWGEALGQNIAALKRWYAQQSPGHRAQWDGEPTIQEAYDAAFSQHRNGSFYAGLQPGESESDPISVTNAQEWDDYRFYLNLALQLGQLRVGEVCAVRLDGPDSKPRYFNIQWLPGDVSPPPPPVDEGEEEPPVVVEPPPPPPPPPPAPPFPAAAFATLREAERWIPPHRIWRRARYAGALLQVASWLQKNGVEF